MIEFLFHFSKYHEISVVKHPETIVSDTGSKLVLAVRPVYFEFKL